MVRVKINYTQCAGDTLPLSIRVKDNSEITNCSLGCPEGMLRPDPARKNHNTWYSILNIMRINPINKKIFTVCLYCNTYILCG